MMKKILAIIGMFLLISPVFAVNEEISNFEKFKERVSLFFIFDKNKKAEKMLDYASKRLEKLSETNNSSSSSKLIEEYQNYIDNAESIANETNNTDLRNEINDREEKHISVLENVYDQVPDQAKYKIAVILDRNIEEVSEGSSLKINHGKALEIIKERNLPRVEIGSIERKKVLNGVCAQVIQPARNQITGECREFSTPCDVPEGWYATEQCSNDNVIRIKPNGELDKRNKEGKESVLQSARSLNPNNNL